MYKFWDYNPLSFFFFLKLKLFPDSDDTQVEEKLFFFWC